MALCCLSTAIFFYISHFCYLPVAHAMPFLFLFFLRFYLLGTWSVVSILIQNCGLTCFRLLSAQSQAAGFRAKPSIHSKEPSFLDVTGCSHLLWPAYFPNRIPDEWEGTGVDCFSHSADFSAAFLAASSQFPFPCGISKYLQLSSMSAMLLSGSAISSELTSLLPSNYTFHMEPKVGEVVWFKVLFWKEFSTKIQYSDIV